MEVHDGAEALLHHGQCSQAWQGGKAGGDVRKDQPAAAGMQSVCRVSSSSLPPSSLHHLWDCADTVCLLPAIIAHSSRRDQERGIPQCVSGRDLCPPVPAKLPSLPFAG